MSDYKDRLAAVRFNPSLMIDIVLSELEAQLAGEGEYDVPDASNPFVALLEASTLNASVGVTEGEALLRRIYPSMAQTSEELYLHMSDDDYIGRFATPAWTHFELYISKAELLQRALAVGDQGVRQLVIPRLSAFTVAETTFTMQYPIQLRVMPHGGIQIIYDNNDVSPIQTLDSNMVDWNQIVLEGEEILVLRVPMGQFKVTTFTETLNSAAGFDTTYGFDDQFYYARVYVSGTNGDWTEIKTTHTDQVYDYRTLTAVLQVNQGTLNVKLPLIYFNTFNLTGEVRIDIYTTKGKLEMDPGSYLPSQYSYHLNEIDDDLTYVSPLQQFTRFSVLNPNYISGGSSAILFEELRQRVINNTLGVSQVPITHASLETELNSRGYTVVTNIDNITNRQFLASRRLNPPLDQSVTSGMGCMMGQLQAIMTTLAQSNAVNDHGMRLTLTPDFLVEYKDGVIQPVLDGEVANLLAMDAETRVRAVNQRRFMYSPFHYVIDATSNNFDVRPYYMDQPSIIRKTFVDDNPTALLQATVAEYQIERIAGGYRFTLKLSSSDEFKALEDANVIVQMGYRPIGENSYASLNGTLIGLEDEERVYQFDLLTTFDIDSNDGLHTTNWSMFDLVQVDFAARLLEDFDVTFIVGNQQSLGYQPSELDTLVQTHLLPATYMAVSRERLNVQLGYALPQLWRRNRTLISPASYQYYANDVPYFYEETVYQRDENGQVVLSVDENDQIVYHILHQAGDPVLDDQGEQVYKHLAGDVVLDGDGNPVLVEPRQLLREFTMLLVEGVYYFVTDEQSLTYRSEVPLQITRWLDTDLSLIQERLLEQSEIFLYPTATIGDTIAVVKEALQSTIALDQTFQVAYYLTDTAINNNSIREALTLSTRQIVNEMLGRSTVSVSDIITRLKANGGDDVISIEAGGLGGEDNNFSVITIKDNAVRMSLKKRLAILSNQLLAVQDDIEIAFYRHTLPT